MDIMELGAIGELVGAWQREVAPNISTAGRAGTEANDSLDRLPS